MWQSSSGAAFLTIRTPQGEQLDGCHDGTGKPGDLLAI